MGKGPCRWSADDGPAQMLCEISAARLNREVVVPDIAVSRQGVEMRKIVRLVTALVLSSALISGVTGATAPGGEGKQRIKDTPAVADFKTCERPEWPKSSLRNEEQGTVTLSFLIGTEGTVNDARVSKSSGFEGLDAAALDGVRKCRFVAATRGGRAVETWMQMQYVWTLEDEPASNGLSAGGSSAQRHAIVLGNDKYQYVSPLRNAGTDAESMAAAFRKAGYKVFLSRDRNLKAMKDDLRAFARQIQAGDEVVFFFSGHGVQIRGENFLLPVDVRADSEEQVRDDAVALSVVLADLRVAQPALMLAIVDACRDNPFPKTGRSIGGRGLSRVDGATGQMVLYAAGEGQQALDRLGNNDTSKNGVFTRVFLKEMERVGVPIDQVLRNVRVEVHRLASTVKHEQVPALYDQVLGTYYFYPPH